MIKIISPHRTRKVKTLMVAFFSKKYKYSPKSESDSFDVCCRFVGQLSHCDCKEDSSVTVTVKRTAQSL
jgi:hypothetical protein